VKKMVVSVLLAVILVFGFSSYADEGMWLLNNLPLEQLKNKYDFVSTSVWVERVQKSSARLPNCSTSFVSEDGLLMTNWHCSEEAVKELSTPENNYYENGFYAPTPSQELKTNLNVRVLMSVTDITKEVNNTAMFSRISPVGMTCEVVILYQGGQYHSYCYKIYNDIRLVFMPEQRVGFFGGDADNFEYPRYTLDVSFLRAYEDGKPVKTPDHFTWSKTGAKEGELMFVSGHPGSTERLLTLSALETERDVRAPFLLDVFRRRELTTKQFMLRGRAEALVVESDLFSWQNARKLYAGKIKGLQDPKLFRDKKLFEADLLDKANGDPVLTNQITEGMNLISEAQKEIRPIYSQLMMTARGLGFDSDLFGLVFESLNLGSNQQNIQSVIEYRNSLSETSLRYEEAKLVDSLGHLVEVFGADSQLVRSVLSDDMSPARAAHQFIYDSFEMEPDVATNPLLSAAVAVVAESYGLQAQYVQAVKREQEGYARLSDAMFKLLGTGVYPDATFTLRLSFGTMSGYSENGKTILPWTTIGDAYRHSADFDNAGDWKLPNKWQKRKSSVNLKTPLNFVSNLDITGGNSGSPVFNRDLEIVGIVFDSNIHGLVSDYDYDYSPQARAVAVHSAGILELLGNVYQADQLVQELIR